MGSTFTIRLPARGEGSSEDDAVVAQPLPAQAHAPGARRVLIVDDNVDAAETLVMMLQLLGQTTRQTHDGKAALEAAAQFEPQIVVMDIGLPGLSGYDVVRRMRGELGMRDVYIVALSGYGSEEDRRKSIEAGFDIHFVKPLDPSALPQILAAAACRDGGGRMVGSAVAIRDQLPAASLLASVAAPLGMHTLYVHVHAPTAAREEVLILPLTVS